MGIKDPREKKFMPKNPPPSFSSTANVHSEGRLISGLRFRHHILTFFSFQKYLVSNIFDVKTIPTVSKKFEKDTVIIT
jgi:hypothetical protein